MLRPSGRFCLVVLCLTSSLVYARIPDLWPETLKVFQLSRELADPRSSRKPTEASLKRRILNLIEDERIEEVRTFLFEEGSLDTDAFLADYQALVGLMATDGDAAKVLNTIGIWRLADLLIQKAPAGEEEPVQAPGFEALESIAESVPFSFAPASAPRSAKALTQSTEPKESAAIARTKEPLAQLALLRKATQEHGASQRAYDSALRKELKRLYQIHTLVVGFASISIAAAAGHFFHALTYSPKEMVALVVATWTANVSLWWLAWELPGFAQARQERKSTDEEKAEDDKLKELESLAAGTLLDNVYALALPKESSRDLRVGPHQRRYGRYLTKKFEGEAVLERLSHLALKHLESGMTHAAREVYEGIKERYPGTSEARQASAAMDLIDLKNKIEWKRRKGQYLRAALKIGGLIAVVLGLDQGFAAMVSEHASTWRRIGAAIAFGGLINPKKVFAFLSAPPKHKPSDPEAPDSDENQLLEKSRALLHSDPTGRILMHMALHESVGGAQPLFFEIALRVLKETVSGEVAKTFLEWVRLERERTDGPSDRIDKITEAAFDHQAACIERLAVLGAGMVSR